MTRHIVTIVEHLETFLEVEAPNEFEARSLAIRYNMARRPKGIEHLADRFPIVPTQYVVQPAATYQPLSFRKVREAILAVREEQAVTTNESSAQ